MPEITRHKEGTFCWAELATNDLGPAKQFYRSLFGWTSNDVPIGESELYCMQQIRGKDVAAICLLPADQRAQGIPPHWFLYVSVDDVDRAALTAATAGGTVVAQPFDVSDSGRMSVIRDPTGAMLGLWQPRMHIGNRLSEEPNIPCWSELLTRDRPSAARFYNRLFGWEMRDSPEYTEFLIGGVSHAGMMDIKDEWGDMPASWGLYFLVDDCDRAAGKAGDAGAAVIVHPTDVADVGRFATLQDPQGAVFSIIKLL